MNEVFVIEKMVVIGVWELLSNIFFTDEKAAIDECLSITERMQKVDKEFCARVTTLKKVEK
jgi:hypothetical protein